MGGPIGNGVTPCAMSARTMSALEIEPAFEESELGAAEFRLEDLPPMPEPNHVARNSESLTGCCVTLAITAARRCLTACRAP